MIRKRIVAALVACTPALAASGGVAQADNGTFALEVVASQLSNPRGMTVAADGTIYVAESGRGGRKCTDVGEGDEAFTTCVGSTSAITRIRNGHQRRVVTGLVSNAGEDGFAATGAQDVAVTPSGRLLFTVGWGNPLDIRRQFANSFDERVGLLGTVMGAKAGGDAAVVRDTTRFEWNNNPDGKPAERGGLESNPYGLTRSGRDRLVVDAGGNSLLRYRPGKPLRAIASFRGPRVTNPFNGERMRADAVPTSVAVGPDGAYYVGELTGFPFEVESARVWRVVPGRAPTVYARGFTNISDVTFDSSGRLLVLEMIKDGLLAAETGGSQAGQLLRVNADGSKSVVVAKGLRAPMSVDVAPDGSIYIVNNGLSVGDGEVVKVNRR